MEEEIAEEMMAISMERVFPRQSERLRAEGKVEMLLGIARKRFGDAPRALEERLQAEPPEELDGWLERLQEAPSIDEAMSGNGSRGNGASVSRTQSPSGYAAPAGAFWVTGKEDSEEEITQEAVDYKAEQMFPRQMDRLRAEGQVEGQVETLLGIAQERFGKTPSALEERLLATSPENLDGWLNRLLRASSIDEAMSGNGSWGKGALAPVSHEATELYCQRGSVTWLEDVGRGRAEEMQVHVMELMFPGQKDRFIAEGKVEGKVEMLLDIAQRRFGDAPRALEERLQAASPEDLDSWQIRLLRAPSIDKAMKGNGSWGSGTSVFGRLEAIGLRPLARLGNLARRLWKK